MGEPGGWLRLAALALQLGIKASSKFPARRLPAPPRLPFNDGARGSQCSAEGELAAGVRGAPVNGRQSLWRSPLSRAISESELSNINLLRRHFRVDFAPE